MMEKNNKEKITHALQEIESNCGQVRPVLYVEFLSRRMQFKQ
jgi:hypothetical protein